MKDAASSVAVAASLVRRERWLGVLLLASGLVLTVAASRVTGPTFDEESRFAAVRRATQLVRAVSDYGPSSLFSSSAEAVYDEIQPCGALPAVISGWFGEVLARAHLLDRIVAARLGWLLFTGCCPGALYFLVLRSKGPRVAALSACALFAMPRWVHAAAAARESAVVASIWIILLALYMQSLPPSLAERGLGMTARFRAAAVAFAIAAGVGLATSLATLWVLPLMVVHALVARPKGLGRALRQGMLPLPSGMLLALLVAPVVMVALTPGLWKGGGAHAAEWLLSPLAPKIEPLLYRGGPVVSPRDVPGGYALRWVIATTPALVLVLALLGSGVVSADYWARRKQHRRDDVALGFLLLLAVVAIIFGPAVTPIVLTRFPPRVEAALPFIATAAAITVDRLASRLFPAKAVFAVLPAAVLFVAYGLVAVPTASASFGLFGGGTARAVDSRLWTVGDGSEVAVLATAIDKLGMPSVTIDATEVPRAFWSTLERAGRLRTRVDVGRAGALTLTLARGTRPNTIAAVSRDGATLWSLARP
ncbi:MAG TPA: hypothetical protein VHC69_02700 [Polyangiaceae bacterium]|nr:hypothetical protein [Polyangiaceae bacterium]